MVMPIVIGNRNSCCYKCQFARCPANQWQLTRLLGSIDASAARRQLSAQVAALYLCASWF